LRLRFLPTPSLLVKYDFFDICQVFEHGLVRGLPVAGFDGIQDAMMTL
jgi:hypothetical protein